MISPRRIGALLVAAVAAVAIGAVLMERAPATPSSAPDHEPGQPFDPGSSNPDATASPTDGSEEPLPRAAPRSVIGTDDRLPVADPLAYPAGAIGRLTFRQRGGSYFCTGFLIAADTVATAGHCVHDGLSDSVEGFSDNVFFTPGQNGIGGSSAPFGSCGVIEVTATDPWLQGQVERFDLGFVRLDCSIGDTVGWFGFEPGGSADAEGSDVTVQGYPFDKPSGTQWFSEGTIEFVTDGLAFYRADSSAGQSGSPVYQMRSCRGATGACVVAVHGYGVHGRGSHSSHNHGVSVTASVAGQFHAATEAAVD